MKQERAPFWEALVAYHAKGIIPFHTPGHKLRSGPFTKIEERLGSGFFALDPSDEVENPDLDHDFEAALKMAEQLAADLFGAESSLFLVNGTTGGLHYLLMPAKGSVIIPRFSHQAVYSAMMLSQGKAVYLPTAFDPEWLIPLQPTAEQIEKELGRGGVEAVVLTHPTYYGTVADLESIVSCSREYGALVFADEAHGGHFKFAAELPPSALESGADAVVQSTHKTLGSFTQTSMLHANNAVWFNKAQKAQRVLQTTSPSLVFFAVLDEVRRVLAEQGQELVGQALGLAWECRSRLGEIRGVELLPGSLQGDPGKIVFSLRDLGLTGIEVERILRVDYNIQVELSDYYSVLALVTLGDTPKSIGRLVHAVRDLAGRRRHLGAKGLERCNMDMPELPPIVLNLREAFFAEQEAVPLQEAAGRVSASFLTPYPPGVPVIAPGEQFTPEIVEHLRWCISINWPVRGIVSGQKVAVLEDNDRFCRT